MFATCSDDTTIALWDIRKLNTKVCTLHGHTSWVKNIEYDTHTRLLVTSGFDGNVIIWDTNRYVYFIIDFKQSFEGCQEQTCEENSCILASLLKVLSVAELPETILSLTSGCVEEHLPCHLLWFLPLTSTSLLCRTLTLFNISVRTGTSYNTAKFHEMDH